MHGWQVDVAISVRERLQARHECELKFRPSTMIHLAGSHTQGACAGNVFFIG